jgi:hypothetical protein
MAAVSFIYFTARAILDALLNAPSLSLASRGVKLMSYNIEERIVVITGGASTWLRRRRLRDNALRNQKVTSRTACSFSTAYSA